RLELTNHLLYGNAAAAWPRLRWEGLVLNVTAGNAGLNILLYCAVRIDRVAVARVRIREDRDIHRQHDLAGIVHHIPHAAARIWPAQLVRGGVAPGHVEHLVAQGFCHLGPHGIHPTGHDEELLLLEEFL